MKNRRKIIRLINKIKRETRRRNIIWEECESLEYDDECSEQRNELVHHFCGHTKKGIIFHIMYLIGASGDIWQLYIEEIVPDICIPAQLLYSTDDPRSASLKHVSESISKEIISSINDVSMSYDKWPCKVGMTTSSITNRILSQSSTALPEYPHVALVIKTEDARKLETMLHNCLRYKKAETENAPGNEWFTSNPAEIKQIYLSMCA